MRRRRNLEASARKVDDDFARTLVVAPDREFEHGRMDKRANHRIDAVIGGLNLHTLADFQTFRFQQRAVEWLGFAGCSCNLDSLAA